MEDLIYIKSRICLCYFHSPAWLLINKSSAVQIRLHYPLSFYLLGLSLSHFKESYLLLLSWRPFYECVAHLLGLPIWVHIIKESSHQMFCSIIQYMLAWPTIGSISHLLLSAMALFFTFFHVLFWIETDFWYYWHSFTSFISFCTHQFTAPVLLSLIILSKFFNFEAIRAASNTIALSCQLAAI